LHEVVRIQQRASTARLRRLVGRESRKIEEKGLGEREEIREVLQGGFVVQRQRGEGVRSRKKMIGKGRILKRKNKKGGPREVPPFWWWGA